jgi:adenylate cyclase
MASQTTYEVYVFSASRWEIHSRFPTRKMEDAVQDAKAQEKLSRIDAVKVIKDTLDDETGLSKEIVVYKSPGQSSGSSGDGDGGGRSATSDGGRSASSSGSDERSGGGHDDSGAQRKKAKMAKISPKPKMAKISPKPKGPGRSGLDGITKFALVVFFSIGIAGILTVVSYLTVLQTNKLFGMTLTGDIRANIMFAIFVVSVLVSVTPLSKAFFPSKPKRKPFPSNPKPRKFKPPKAAPPKRVKLEKPVAITLIEDLPPLDDSPPREEEKEEKPVLSPALEQQKVLMMQFLSESLKIVQANKTPLNAMSKFGINMFLAGACEAQAQKNGLDAAETQLVLSESVQVIGFSKEQADGFAEKADAYLLADPSYMQMYEAGRSAMNTSMEGDAGSSKDLNAALMEWSRPKEKQNKAGTIAVMFTDMVGSTALTQAKGDASAQHVVRAHNRIVRDALRRFQGKEIKHTGDGIMCSFAQTSNSVEAASEIMRNTRAYTEATPEYPLHLKIGINAGEPIAEDDDLFGTTVQISARIVDKAQSGQIFVSEIVRGICAGKPIQFANAGGFQMKGITEPVALHKVIWDEAV